ncbi:MAG: hypothetical protein ACFFCS_14260 [Candidatus Hodarchaeota archaeon]
MYNIKTLLEQKKKLIGFLTMVLIGLLTLGISLIPAMNYLTGENMSARTEFWIPVIYIILYTIFILSVIIIIVALSYISKKLYVVKKIDESIRGIKKGKYLDSNTAPRREELLQAHYADRMRAAGLSASRLMIFDGITDVEKNSIIRFNIDDDMLNETKLD